MKSLITSTLVPVFCVTFFCITTPENTAAAVDTMGEYCRIVREANKIVNEYEDDLSDAAGDEIESQVEHACEQIMKIYRGPPSTCGQICGVSY